MPKLLLVASFKVELTILIFGATLLKNSICDQNRKKVNITTEFCKFEFVWVPNFSLIWKFQLFGPPLPKKSISDLRQQK